MKSQSGDPMFEEYSNPKAWEKWYAHHSPDSSVMQKANTSKTDINFEAQSRKVYDLVHDQLRPALKKMTGRYYQKMLDDMTTIEKLLDEMRREAGNLGI